MDRVCNYPRCGRDSCVVLITGPECYWCDVVKKKLDCSLDSLEVSTDIVKVVDVSKEPFYDHTISQLPTLRICETELTGLPQCDDLNSEILRMMSMACFHESLVA